MHNICLQKGKFNLFENIVLHKLAILGAGEESIFVITDLNS